MPRLSKSETEKNDDVIRGVLRGGMEMQNLNASTLASITGIGRTTLYDRLQNPKSATIGEVGDICKKLKLPEEMKQMLREAIIP